MGDDDGTDEDLPSLFYETPPDPDHDDHARIYHYTITTRPFDARTLKYKYVCSNKRMKDHLRLRIDRATLMELRKFEARNFDEYIADPYGLRSQIEFVERPSGWTYWDEEVPKWYKGWDDLESKRIEEMLE
ncbi:hypothetical protein P7C71_g6514, partial [Lecanoromycetidae sp. Uapishka_2]